MEAVRVASFSTENWALLPASAQNGPEIYLFPLLIVYGLFWNRIGIGTAARANRIRNKPAMEIALNSLALVVPMVHR
ncbi:MAG: hypothetical protein ACFFB3_23010 [Candidatus Hodarchaeota archaeon]